uniref:Uncharacterized protein n=1 Tax=Kalanchoe fedtschenkoi TaxID=63787 RepID=A0A7N0RAY9_KALFE
MIGLGLHRMTQDADDSGIQLSLPRLAQPSLDSRSGRETLHRLGDFQIWQVCFAYPVVSRLPTAAVLRACSPRTMTRLEQHARLVCCVSSCLGCCVSRLDRLFLGCDSSNLIAHQPSRAHLSAHPSQADQAKEKADLPVGLSFAQSNL